MTLPNDEECCPECGKRIIECKCDDPAEEDIFDEDDLDEDDVSSSCWDDDDFDSDCEDYP